MDRLEEWRTIPGFQEYEVSNYGLVFSKRNQVLLCLKPDSWGYFRTEITDDNGDQRAVRIHVLVAAAFIGPKPNGMEVNHKNGVKNDNRLDNLEYATPQENMQHAFRTGLKKPIHGDAHWKTKISKKDEATIKRLYSSGKYTMAQIGKMYGVSKTPIRNIIRNLRASVSPPLPPQFGAKKHRRDSSSDDESV